MASTSFDPSDKLPPSNVVGELKPSSNGTKKSAEVSTRISSSENATTIKLTKKYSKMRRKVLKDPAAPKKPLNAYVLFSHDTMPNVVAELGNLSAVDIMKKVAKRWSLADKATREKYENAQKLDKKRYDSEIKLYRPSEEFLARKAKFNNKDQVAPTTGLNKNVDEYFRFLTEHFMTIAKEYKDTSPKEVQDRVWNMWSNNLGKSKKKIKKARYPEEPKRPLSAFFLFQNHMRREMIKHGSGEIGRKEMMKAIAEKWANLDPDLKVEFEGQASKLREEYQIAMKKFKAQQ